MFFVKTSITKFKTPFNALGSCSLYRSSNFLKNRAVWSWTYKRGTSSFVAYFPAYSSEVSLYCRSCCIIFRFFFMFSPERGNCEMSFLVWWLNAFFWALVTLFTHDVARHTKKRVLGWHVTMQGVCYKNTVPKMQPISITRKCFNSFELWEKIKTKNLNIISTVSTINRNCAKVDHLVTNTDKFLHAKQHPGYDDKNIVSWLALSSKSVA